MFENRVLRRMFRLERKWQDAGADCIKSFIT
jgi:hypothetical protein